MARDNVKHRIPQVGITIMGRRATEKELCSREIGG